MNDGVWMDLISIRDLDKETIEGILSLSARMESDLASGTVKKREGVLATLFFEPSTRTKLSFQTAANRLGMQYIDFFKETSSLKKGESFIDTIKTVSGYADLLVIRHPKEGSTRLAADVCDTPVINGGDGSNQHPTQTLIDLYTMSKHKNGLKELNVVLVGDLKHARTMHSLLYALSMFGANITLTSPKGLEMDNSYVEEVGVKFGAHIKKNNVLNVDDADVLYVCRIQEERFADPYEAKRVKAQFMITKENLKGAKEGLMILHPLPKIGEIAPEIDATPWAMYFEQAHYGVPVRMAVIEWLLRG